MTDYEVSWTIDLDGDNPVDAARRARAFQLDHNSTATVFHVTDRVTGETTKVDLSNHE